MKKLFFASLSFWCLLCLAYSAWAQVNGDYRTQVATGNWSALATWQVRTAGTWATATSLPTSTNNVYIQDGHAITVDVSTAACNNFNIDVSNGTASLTVSTGNRLAVSGIMRTYQNGTAVTSSADGTFYSGQADDGTTEPLLTTSGTGIVQIVGNSRTVFDATSWWNSPNTAATTLWDLEFALTAGQTGTVNTNLRARNFTFTSGTVVMGVSTSSTVGLRPDGGASLGSITISNGATLRMNQGSIVRLTSGGASGRQFSSLTLNSGGTLEFAGAASASSQIAASTLNFSGTVSFSAINDQTLPIKPASATLSADPNTFTNVILTGTGVKSLSQNTTVNGTLTVTQTNTPSTLSFSNGGFTLTYGASATLAYVNAIAGAAYTTGNEFTSTVNNLTINATGGSSAGVTLGSAGTVNGTLTLTSGLLITTTSNLLTLSSANAISGGSSSSYILGPVAVSTNGVGTNYLLHLGTALEYRTLRFSRAAGGNSTYQFLYSRGNPKTTFSTSYPTSPDNIQDISAFEYFDVTRPTGTDALTSLQLSWGANSQITSALANLRVMQSNGAGTWTNLGNGGTTGNATSGTIITNTAPGALPTTSGTTSGFALGTTEGSLPVRWLSFTAQRVGAGVQLDWATAAELNNRGFDIERSNSATFENAQTIGFVSGAGTTNAQQRYTYVDAAAPAGALYYRLKQQDFDGTFEYSTIVLVGSNADQPTFSISPNPSTGEVRLTGANVVDGAVEVLPYNSLGTQLLGTRANVADALVQLNAQLATAAPGLYTLVIRKGNHSQNLRLVRQ